MERARYDAIVATFVGVLALCVSAYTAYVQRQQVRAQVYPILSFSTGYSDADVHVNVSNKGSGPALIRNVVLTLDDQPLSDWLELVRRVVGGKEKRQRVELSYSSFGRLVLSAGEEAHVFTFTCPKSDDADKKSAAMPSSDPVPREESCAQVVQAIRRLSVSICYCSTLDDCWTLVDGPNQEAVTTETRHCPARTDRSFN